MRAALVVGLVACGSPGPKPATPPTPVVTGTPACVDMSRFNDTFWAEAELGLVGELLHVCYEEGEEESLIRQCVGIDLTTGRSLAVAQAEPVVSFPDVPSGKLELRAGRPLACAPDGTCNPLGKAAAQAVASAEGVEVSADARVVIGGGAVWNVLQDRKLDLPPPDDARGEYSEGSFSTFGRHIIGAWTPCAGPCTITRVYSSEGKLLGDTFPSQRAPVPLDAKHFAIVDADDLVIHDLESGARLRAIDWGVKGDPAVYQIDGVSYVWDTGGGPNAIPMIPLGGTRAAITTRAEPTITVIDFVKGTVVRRYRVALCKDEDALEDAEKLR